MHARESPYSSTVLHSSSVYVAEAQTWPHLAPPVSPLGKSLDVYMHSTGNCMWPSGVRGKNNTGIPTASLPPKRRPRAASPVQLAVSAAHLGLAGPAWNHPRQGRYGVGLTKHARLCLLAPTPKILCARRGPLRMSRKNKVSGTGCEDAALPFTMYTAISGTDCNLPCVLRAHLFAGRGRGQQGARELGLGMYCVHSTAVA